MTPSSTHVWISALFISMFTLACEGDRGPVGPAGRDLTDPRPGSFRLTLLHNNDGESALLSAGSGELADYGGVHRFATVLTDARMQAQQDTDGSILVSSGDNFLAGPNFQASIVRDTFFDATAIEALDYDAICLGNHDFDFGPDLLADFIGQFAEVQYLSSNLDFTNEPALQALVDSGEIAASTTVAVGSETVGIVGATTEALRSISGPRNVIINDVAASIQAEVDTLTAAGVNKIIVISHLQSLAEDLELAPELRGVDLMVAGGGDELLARPENPLIPGSMEADTYPVRARGADGRTIYVVTTEGGYRYLGRIVVDFDDEGQVVNVVTEDSGPIRVSGADSDPDSVMGDVDLLNDVIDPVTAEVDALAQNVIGNTEVDLNGVRADIRTMETNLGNVIGDAFLWQATALSASFGVDAPQVALANGGGIRNNSVLAEGDLSELDTFSILPFSNFMTVVEDVPAIQFKEILENAVSRVEFTDGRFAQIGGFRFTYDPNGTPQIVTDDGVVTSTGTRVRSVEILDADGNVTRTVVSNGVVTSTGTIDIATVDFLARGGDQYPFRGAPFTILVGVSYQQALRNFIDEPVLTGGLEGTIRADDYPVEGSGRITPVSGAR